MSSMQHAVQHRLNLSRIYGLQRKQRSKISRPLGSGGGGFSSSVVLFGYSSIGSGAIQMNPGAVKDGTNWYTCDAAQVTLSSGLSYVLCRYSRGNRAEYINPAPSSIPGDEPDKIIIPILQLYNGQVQWVWTLGAVIL